MQFNSINTLAMKNILLVIFFTITALFGVGEVCGQTYTFDSSRANCDGTWADGDCWNITNDCTDGNSTEKPPITLKNTGCPINIIINSNVTMPDDISFGRVFNNLTVNPNYILTFSGNVTIKENSNVTFTTNTSQIIVNGTNGIILEASSGSGKTTLNIDGNNLGNITTTKIDLENDVNLNMKPGGSLITTSDTFFSGKGITFTVDGFFRTKNLRITGNGNILRTSDGSSGVVIIEGDVDLTGGGNPRVDAGIDLNGFSEMEIGGDIKVAGTSTFEIGPDATVKMCGENKTLPTDGNIKGDIQLGGCFFILPVDLIHFNASYKRYEKHSFLNWITAKETSNSHFEIERSDKGISDFKKVGEVDGMGWKDTVTEYEFIDDKLPLSGGNILYRIKQVDFDGNFTYSKVLSVRAEGVQATQGVWRAFPNPTMGDQLRISLLDRTQYDEEQITFRIVHPNLITQGITVNSENEMNDQLAQLIPRAPKGVLVVEIQWGQKVEHIKVLKK